MIWQFKPLFKRTALALSVIGLTACGGNDNDFADVPQQPTPPPPVSPPTPAPAVPNFDSDGVLEANIRWTTYGVPHVTADNLESMSYGVGYAFAKDNICVLADQIIRYNSQRAKFYGPDMNPGSGDSAHLINDFGFLTLGIRDIAEENFASLSANTRAMLSGYTQGYNRYLSETGSANIDGRCAGQPWVQPIDSVDLLTYSLGVALLPGAANFLSAMFVAAPPGESFLPTPVNSPEEMMPRMSPTVELPEMNPLDLGSNGWGLGSDKTENGQGILLANPHFPHTGALRFWQFHTTIPGHLDVTGGSLMGLPGAVNIGFNENVAWTHTFSTAEHFVMYQLSLEDDSNLSHTVDGSPRTIFSQTHEIDVAVGPGQTIKLAKTSYSTNYGPMVVVPGNFEWGPGGNAFAIKDANLPNFDVIDHWLAMNLANDMDEFKQAFKDYDGVIFNNTMATSKDGQVFYIDDSTVPRLTATAINELTTNPLLVQTRAAAGFTVLPGFLSAFDFDRPVPYEEAPKYEGSDYVQNSNDSFWLTNLENPITGVSPLYGQVDNQQSLRSRMAHRLLADSSGSDNLFSPAEVEEALLNNRNYLGESVATQLLSQCEARGDDPVMVDGNAVNLSEGCTALAGWDGRMNLMSSGAPLFREFAFQFNRAPQWVVPFDAADPVNTPRELAATDTTLEHFARAIVNMQTAGIALDATMGEVQFVERSTVAGQPSGNKLPWGGAHNIEGGFNVFDTRSNDPTLLPRHSYAPINSSTRLSAEGEGYHINYGSSWMIVMNFTEDGPQANGILTYSQSSNRDSDHFLDQTLLYSSQPQLRPMLFTEAEIEANKIMELNLSSQ
ncbi:acylase [Alteromonas oceanisediminis]|uniref:acylase n=1 Tax=Alteromonas oceanisediminis TaxID=2836180 RepID=UPI001BDA8053|nr:acylase [Alteromonas oceanisediminis]MBT0586447.1 acylase [Alteromonas oceanisediminis]